jgi:hypothetical protein
MKSSLLGGFLVSRYGFYLKNFITVLKLICAILRL